MYDRDQVTAIVSLLLVALVLLRDPDAVTESPPDIAAVSAPSVQANAVLRVAQAEIGYEEGARNRNKYGAAYGVDNTLWCMQFAWWVGQQAGAGDLIPKTAFTPTAARWYRDRGQWSTEPRVGSLVFFNWPDRLDRIQHVEIVEAIGANSITTIGGNTGSGPSGSQDDGDGVWRRDRPRDASIVGYGHPAYTT